jgi:TP901 family phage tail tape measure protein
MADIESNVKVNIDTSDALAQLKLLQQQISAFQQAMRKAGADNAAAARQMQQNLVNSINATGKFQANIQTIQTSAERFTTALEKNKLSMGEYFRYAGGASKTFGKLFKAEFDTINQVARERVKDLQTQYIKLGRDANGAMKAISVRPLSLDMDNLATKTQIAAQRQQLFNQLMKQGSTQLLNFGKNTQWAGRQLMVGFTIPLTLMGSAASKAYMQIEKASISFKRVYGDINTTTAETEKMAKAVQGLANEFTKYGVAVSETMDMAAKAAAMGKTGADLLAQVSQAAKLAVLGQVDQNQALETTISLTNAFGTSADDLANKINFLNAVENQTVTSIEDLTIAIPKAAPVIQQLGGDVEDLTFFLTAMKEGGINASEGANALKSGLASMINPSKKASEFLAGFNINVKGIVESNKGDVRATVIGMAKAFDTLDPLNRARAIEQLFGKFQFSRISTLFQNVIKEGSQANTVAGLAKQTAEELSVLSEREMKKISDSPLYKFQKSIQDIQTKLAPVGEAFLKAVTPIMEFVGKVLDGFNNLSDGTKNFITILVTAVAGIGPILLMTFGLIANGVANIMKLFTNIKGFFNKTTKPSDVLGEQTSYMTSEQLKGAAIAASLDQAHAKLRQTFTSETQAVNDLTAAYRNAVQAQQAFSGVPGVPVGDPNAMTPKKYANGVSMVPGPKGAGDIVPALLSPGEAVIPAKYAKKYAPVISGMVAGNLPGFENGTTGAGMRQSVYGPLTQKQTEGLARTGSQLKDISDEVMAGPYGKVPPTDFGVQVSPTTGHSFPAFSVGGIYQKPDGTRVFVKPQMDLTSALAEVRGTTIARDAHGLVAPKQEIRVMMDPTDPEQQRRFIVLESALDSRIADIPNTFTKDQYFKQLVASLLRGDKDLGIGNLGGDVLADVGTAGVFGRASGKRALGSAINSMEEQAIINLLGVKGGAKRFFAEATSEMVSKMSPAEYDAAMKSEIQAVAPKLQATIASFGNLSPEEKVAYQAMQQRLQAGMGVDWSQYQIMHSAVPPKKFEDGGWAGLTQASHTQSELDKNDPAVRAQIEAIYPGLKDEHLQYITVLGNLTADLPTWVNQRLIPGKGGIVPPIFQKVWNSIQGKFASSAMAAGVPGNLNSTLAQIEDTIGSTTVSVAAGRNVIDPILADGTKQALFSSVAMGGDHAEVANRLIERSNTVGSIRADLGKNADGKLRELLATGIAEFAPNGKDVVFAGTKIKIGRFALASSTGKPEKRAEQEASRASWIASGAVASELPEELKLRGSSIPPGSFRRSLTGISSYDELLARITSVSDPNVFDEKLFMSAQGFAEGTENVGGKPSIKPKASVFDIDDTLLDLSSFMAKHQAENEKLPEDQKKKWYKEVAKDPKGIPAGLAALKAAQQRGNKILLMTARPDFYEPYTIETLQKLGIDMNGIKLIARKDKDYRKPEQMKYDKTAAYMKYYDIEEFYDDMDKTRGAISLLGINAINPLKLADGIASVPGKIGPLHKDYKPPITAKFGKPYYGIQTPYEGVNSYSGLFTSLEAAEAYIAEKELQESGAEPVPMYGTTMGGPVQWGIETDYEGVYEGHGLFPNKRSAEAFIAEYASQFTDPEHARLVASHMYPSAMHVNNDPNKKLTFPGGSLLPKKYANGVFSVPGPKGAGDIVPAMLSPGEAVIPAKQAAQHRPMIRQMIAGNLPGYNMGTAGVPGYFEGEDDVQSGGKHAGPGFFSKLGTSILEGTKKAGERLGEAVVAGTKKAGEVLVEKAKDAGETVGLKFAKYITDGKTSFTDDKGTLRYNAETGETFDKNGELVVKKQKELVEKQKEVNIAAQEEYVNAQLLGDQEYRLALEKVNKYNLMREYNQQFTEEERRDLAEQQQIMQQKKKMYQENFVAEQGGSLPGGAAPQKKTLRETLFTRTAGTGKVQGAAYGVTSAVAAVSAIPENVVPGIGKAAQAALPSIGAFTTGMSLIPGPAGIAVGAVMGLITIFMQIGEALKKMREEAYATAQALGASNTAINKYADFAKTVSGTDAMNKKREASAGQFFNVVEGKTTFGESYMKTDAGKELVKSVSGAIANGDMDQAEQMIAQQLSTAVASGVMTPAQARSIAANLGKQLKNTDFGMTVVGKISKMFGPGGEDLEKDPLGVRLKVSKESGETFKKFADDAAWAFNGGFGQAEKLGGSLAAQLQSALDSQQQMADSLQITYEKRIATARKAGDEAEAINLQNTFLIEQQKLLASNSATSKQMFEDFKNLDPAMIGQAKEASLAAIDTAYKGTGMEGIADARKQQINNMKGTDAQKAYLASLVSSKTVGLDQVNTADKVFGGTQEGADKLNSMLTNIGGVETNRALGLAANMDGKQQKQFLVNMAVADPAKAKELLDSLEMAQKTVGPFADDDVTKKAIIDFSVKNQQKMLDISKEMKVLDGLSGKKITLAVTSGKLGKDFANVLKKDIDRFNKYNDAGKVTYIRELKQIMAMEGDETMQNAYKAWVGEMGDPTLTFEDFARYQSDRTVRDSGIDQTTGPGAQKKKEAEAPKPSILDPYVQALKEASNWQQRLTTGWNASLKALKNYSDKAIKTMAGSAIIMQQAGADANFIQAFLGGTEEEQNKIINKTTGKLTKVGRDLIEITKKVEDAKIGMAYILMSESERLAKDNELYQAGLEVISIKEKKINDKYDARVKVLDEIGKMQERNNQHQQDTLDLAGALSRGDIAAAAQIALKAKQNAQKQALEDAKASLELQRKNEINAIEITIGGHVQKRSDLEKLIADNSERIAAAKLLEMDRQAQIHKDALASAKAVAQMLADGKKIAALPGYNGYNGQQKKQQQQYGNDPSKAGQMGYDKKGNIVSNPYQGMAALRLDKQGKQAVWDFKNAKWTTAAWDKNAGKDNYVQDKNSPGKWIPLQQAGVDFKKYGPAAFATKEAAQKAAGAGETVVWEYNAQKNEGFWTTKKGALGTQENPITAPQPKSGSSMVNGRGEKFQVEKNKYFRMPPGVYVYSVIKTGKGYEIT